MCDARMWGAEAPPMAAKTCGACGAVSASRRPSDAAPGPSRRRPGRVVRLAAGVRRLMFVVDLALEVRRERRNLLRMNDQALKDIGMSRNQVYAEAHRSLWDIPGDRLLLL